MSPSSSLLCVSLLVMFLISVVSGATLGLYSDTACSTQLSNTGGIAISNGGSACFGISGVTGVGSAQLTCASSGSQTAAGVALFSDTQCSSNKAVGVGQGNYNGACSTSGIFTNTNINSFITNCNAAINMHTISYVTILVLAILAIMLM